MKMLALALAVGTAALAFGAPASAQSPHHPRAAQVNVYKPFPPYGVVNRRIVRHDRYGRHDWRRAHASACYVTKVRTPTRYGVVIRTIRHCR